MSSNSRPRRSTRKAQKDPWDEDELMTSDKSNLIALDLVKILAKPEAWNCLEEDEKKQILNLLPEQIHPNPDPPADDPEAKIAPLPQEFLRYSNNWRGGVRQFQVDLECGRYGPEWLSQADDAMKERAVGEFDNWKEKEFEQFWGQKQKLGADAATGEASQVKLETLVEHGVVRVGDVWKYERSVFLEKGNSARLLIEKEVKIVDIVGASLTFAIPAGERVVFPHHVQIPEEKLAVAAAVVHKPARARRPASNAKTVSKSQPKRATRPFKRRGSAEQTGSRKRQQRGHEDEDESPESIMPNANGQESSKDADDIQDSAAEGSSEHPSDRDPGFIPVESHTETAEATEPTEPSAQAQTHGQANDRVSIANICEPSRSESTEDATQPTETIKTEEHEQNDASQPIKPDGESEEHRPKEEASKMTSEPVEQPPKSQFPTTPASLEDIIILPNMTRPSILEHNILAIDGRRKGLRNANSWKAFRCHRNNQDIGNLWELRQAWYLKHYAQGA